MSSSLEAESLCKGGYKPRKAELFHLITGGSAQPQVCLPEWTCFCFPERISVLYGKENSAGRSSASTPACFGFPWFGFPRVWATGTDCSCGLSIFRSVNHIFPSEGAILSFIIAYSHVVFFFFIVWVRRMTWIFLKWKSGFFALLSYVTWSIDSWPWLCVRSTWGTSGELRVQHRTPEIIMLNTLSRWCTGLGPTEFIAAFLCWFRLCLNVHFRRAHSSRKALGKPGFYL